MKDLFVLNERIVLESTWKYGKFWFSAVGATNVGKIVLNFEENLKTNLRKEKGGMKEYMYPVLLDRGEKIGGFKLGSSIVLVFEAPAWEWLANRGDKIKVGQALGKVAV